MKQITSSQAKQNFGELLNDAAQNPVAIERHKKVRAIVCSPQEFQRRSSQETLLADRRAARATHALVEKDRLIRHQRLAIHLLLAPRAEQNAMVAQAREEVARWRRDHLCSADYIDRWDALLALPVKELARAMGSESLGWGIALRQNSPWQGMPA
jgi:PHD/YefM family antitoxin component YafN of YafNO toxin-antitoxin module